MPYLICENCNIYYEIDDDFNIHELEKCEQCEEELKYYQNMDNYFEETVDDTFNEIHHDDHPHSKTKTEYNIIPIVGLFVALIGLGLLLLAYISPFIFISQNIENLNSTSSLDTTLNIFSQIVLIYVLSFVFMTAGAVTYIWSKRKTGSIKKSSGRVKESPNYFSHLPEGYFILNKVKIPLKKINFDHVVIGPTGIFLIKIKRLKGNFIINENKIYKEKGNRESIMAGSHGRKLKGETVEFGRFLASKGLNIPHLMISTIISFSNDNFKIEKKPSFYEVLKLEQIDDYIINTRRKMKENDIIEVMVNLEPYSNEILRT